MGRSSFTLSKLHELSKEIEKHILSKQGNSSPSMSMLTIVPVGAGEQRHVFFVLPDNANNLGGMFWKGDCPKDAIVIEFMVNNPVMIIMRILWVYRSL